MFRQGVIERYRGWLPEIPDDAIATIGEGGTPLIEAPTISERVGVRLFLKFEGRNPTASFKDRGMTVAMSRAVAAGSRACVCASTGNTAASAAAYAARAGVECFVVVPAGKIASGKAVQVLAHGARIVQIEGNFDAALGLSQRIEREIGDVTLVNSVNPDRIEGQKTAAFEVAEVLGSPPDALALPVGNAGNITSYWKGFSEWREAGQAARRRACSVFSRGRLASGRRPRLREPETVASAIRIGSPASKKGPLCGARFRRAHRERHGRGDPGRPGDASREEGVFCEPPAAGIAASKARRRSRGPEGTVVSVLTGHGLKDPDVILGRVQLPDPVPATFEAVAGQMRGR